MTGKEFTVKEFIRGTLREIMLFLMVLYIIGAIVAIIFCVNYSIKSMEDKGKIYSAVVQNYEQ
jgi:hypothetical protein